MLTRAFRRAGGVSASCRARSAKPPKTFPSQAGPKQKRAPTEGPN